MTFLLDVNSLIAAIWSNHPDHSKTDSWLEGKNLATCPLSELGFLRISTNPKAVNADMTIARKLLEGFLENQKTEFIPDHLPALKSKAQKSLQVTDCYLADLAASKGMKLATLDGGIGHPAVEIIK